MTAIDRHVVVVVADAEVVGHCNGCKLDDRRVALVEVGRMSFRLCGSCASALVEDLQLIPSFVV